MDLEEDCVVSWSTSVSPEEGRKCQLVTREKDWEIGETYFFWEAPKYRVHRGGGEIVGGMVKKG